MQVKLGSFPDGKDISKTYKEESESERNIDNNLINLKKVEIKGFS